MMRPVHVTQLAYFLAFWPCVLPLTCLRLGRCRNRFTPFLCVDPVRDETPGEQDAEEFLSAQQVSVDELRQHLVGGEMLLPSLQTCVSGLAKLEKLGALK